MSVQNRFRCRSRTWLSQMGNTCEEFKLELDHLNNSLPWYHRCTLADPSYNISLTSNSVTDNTLIYDNQGQCDQGFTQTECLIYRGGMFDSSKSTSYGVASNIDGSGADSSDTFVNATSDVYSTDVFHFTPDISSEVAFGIRRVNTAG
jgi:hypothetical protein